MDRSGNIDLQQLRRLTAANRSRRSMSQVSRRWIRIFFAGTGSAIVAIVVMAGMNLWLPRVSAGIAKFVLPLVLVPLVCIAFLFHYCLYRRTGRYAIVAIFTLFSYGMIGTVA